MRIGFDARMVGRSGIGTYARALLEQYARIAPDIEFVVMGPGPLLSPLVLGQNLSIRDVDIPIYSLCEQLRMPWVMRDLELVHCPHYNIPVLRRQGLVVTIHDLIHILIREELPGPWAVRYARFMLAKAVRKARHIVTGSVNTKADLVNYLGAPEEKISVIPYGVDDRFHPIRDASQLDEFRNRLALPERFILCVGNQKPHKNLDTLVKAFARIRDKVPEKLVIAGKPARTAHDLSSLVRSLGIENDCMLPGAITDGDMPLLYNLAALLVFPSLYEGFGLPPLEAMACGIPVVASNRASLPEVIGDAGVLVEPTDRDALADAMVKVLSDSELRSGLVRKGVERAKRFSWTETARLTLQVYRQA